MGGRGLDEVDVSIDAGAAIPAGVQIGRVIHADEQFVGLVAEVRVLGQIEIEGDEAARATADFVAVEPDLGELVDSLEDDGHAFAAPVFGEFEVLAVPTDATGQEAGAATGLFLREVLGDRPVVRKAHGFPVRVFNFVSEVEFPIEVEVLFDASWFGATDAEQ